ncbi:CHAT domain-containing protein [Ephemerocybe angulata]|uniref:CHAT domain-containing protein n=1 Tax=Ephemerocybe angulata TaxID=980116 RepID=A0A8H6M7D9_9AGAR|nr:CHAT domain-containing protein [Tulosesus angulatus]
MQRRAVEHTPDDDSDLPQRLHDLGLSLHTRYDRTRELFDLSEAVAMLRKALELSPPGDENKLSWLNNLGMALRSRFRRTEEMPDLAEAISVQQRAVDLTPNDHPAMPTRLVNLGSSLELLFSSTGDIRDINQAIAMHREAVRLTSDDHADKPSWIGALCSSLQDRFQVNEKLSDLSEVISSTREMVRLTPDGHGNMSRWLGQLGLSLVMRYRKTGDVDDAREGISRLGEAVTCKSGSPQVKLGAAGMWTSFLMDAYPPAPPSIILPAFDTTLHLIELTATLEQTLQRRYTELQESSGIPLRAACAAFTIDRADKALEWLERGRCLVWGQLTNLRRPLDSLRQYDPHLTDNILEVSKKLDAAGSALAPSRTEMSSSEKTSLEEQAQDNLSLARRWDSLLDQARVFPGFENFLKPLQWHSLLEHLPESGPVIVINIDERRCDAIALQAGKDRPFHIPLPDFSLERCNQYRGDLAAQLQSYQLRNRGECTVLSEDGNTERGIRSANLRGKRGETVIQGILRALWKEIAKPILTALNMSKIHQSRVAALPRIWWCPTGPLSFLPIHAAGIYGDTGSESILDYAVSSYTPTVAALTERVRSGAFIEEKTSGLFITSQPSPDGVSSIPGTTKEVLAIYDITKKGGIRVEKLDGMGLTATGCLDHMETCSSVHLACHATQDAEDPLRSRFIFHSGPLELGSILQRNLKNADLAFLSACQTSTGAQKLPDEAVHLAAGMLAAGYRRVVATMWSIGDRHAPDVAADFYQYLLSRRYPTSDAAFDGRHSAHALHHAIQQLRLRLPDNSDKYLLTWIPYVHFGY